MDTTRILHPGKTHEGWPVFICCKLTIKDGRITLSITGVEGPMRNGDARGSCGQIVDFQVAKYAPGWTPETVEELRRVWNRWHLSDMRAGCEHQRAEGWSERPIDPSKPLDSYGKHYEGQSHPSWNMLVRVTRKEHPEGLLSEPCPVCGYKYGTAWLYEDLPADVFEFLGSLPESKEVPAWV